MPSRQRSRSSSRGKSARRARSLGSRSRSRSRGAGGRRGSKDKRLTDSRRRPTNNGAGSRGASPEPDADRYFVADSDGVYLAANDYLHLDEMESKCGAVFNLQNRRKAKLFDLVQERYCDIKGTDDQRKEGRALLLEQCNYVREGFGEKAVLKDERDPHTEEMVTLLEVREAEIGRIVGKRGQLIREIEQETRTKIDICKRRSLVSITGLVRGRETAQDRILDHVDWCKNKADGEILKDGPAAARDPPTYYQGTEPPIVMFILDKEAGRVIGRGGEVVREIMDKSGADIRVQKSESICENQDVFALPNERMIEIFGNKKAQDIARNLILEEVCYAKNEQNEIIKDEDQDNMRDVDQFGFKTLKGGKRIPPCGAWVCGFCNGDHRTKDCPAQMQNYQNLQSLQILGFHCLPSPIPGMPCVLAPPGMAVGNNNQSNNPMVGNSMGNTMPNNPMTTAATTNPMTTAHPMMAQKGLMMHDPFFPIAQPQFNMIQPFTGLMTAQQSQQHLIEAPHGSNSSAMIPALVSPDKMATNAVVGDPKRLTVGTSSSSSSSSDEDDEIDDDDL